MVSYKSVLITYFSCLQDVTISKLNFYESDVDGAVQRNKAIYSRELRYLSERRGLHYSIFNQSTILKRAQCERALFVYRADKRG